MAAAPRSGSRPWWAVVVALLLASLTAAAALIVWRVPDSGGEERRLERLATATAVADARRPWFTDARRQAETIAAAVAERVGTTDRLRDDVLSSQQLAELSATATRLDDGVFLVDVRGRVVATVQRKAALLRQTRGGVAIATAAKGRTAVSGVVLDPLERRPVVRVAAPVVVAGKTVGAVVGDSRVVGGTVGLALVPTTDLGDVTVTVVTPDFRVVGPGGSTSPVSQDIEPAAQALRRGERMLDFAGEGGAARTAASAPISDGWTVVVHSDAEVLVRSGERPVAAVALLGLVCLSAIGVVSFAAARTVKVRRQADAAQRAMLSVTGHELRTPLTIILGQSRTLARRWDSLGVAQRKELVTGIGHQARTLERLVERLLHAAQLAARVGRGLPAQPVDLTAVAAESVAATEALAPLHDVRLATEEPVRVMGDAGALRQVLGHLLDNAVRYSPGGGLVEVTIRTRTKWAELVISDEGVGLPADRDRIFEGFVQGEQVDVRVHDEGGVGLGLTIVRDLVAQMGGSVRAEDNVPHGARFVVELPIAPRSD